MDAPKEGGPGGGNPPAATPPATTPPAPSFVPADEFKRFEGVVSQTLGTIKESLSAIAADRTARGELPAAPPPIADVTDAELQKAMEEDPVKVPGLIRKMMRATEERIRREEVAPLRQQGEVLIANLAQAVGKTGMPRYDRFKAEIDRRLASLPAAYRVSPEVYKSIHDAVVGENVEAIVKEEVEKAIRQAREPEPVLGEPGTKVTGRTQPTTPQVPTAVELFGADVADEIARKGGEETYAKRLGYPDWAAYAKLTKEMTGGGASA